jgi:hypothetical protein
MHNFIFQMCPFILFGQNSVLSDQNLEICAQRKKMLYFNLNNDIDVDYYSQNCCPTNRACVRKKVHHIVLARFFRY